MHASRDLQKFTKPPPRHHLPQEEEEEHVKVPPWKFSPQGKSNARDRYGVNLSDLATLVSKEKGEENLPGGLITTILADAKAGVLSAREMSLFSAADKKWPAGQKFADFLEEDMPMAEAEALLLDGLRAHDPHGNITEKLIAEAQQRTRKAQLGRERVKNPHGKGGRSKADKDAAEEAENPMAPVLSRVLGRFRKLAENSEVGSAEVVMRVRKALQERYDAGMRRIERPNLDRLLKALGVAEGPAKYLSGEWLAPRRGMTPSTIAAWGIDGDGGALKAGWRDEAKDDDDDDDDDEDEEEDGDARSRHGVDAMARWLRRLKPPREPLQVTVVFPTAWARGSQRWQATTSATTTWHIGYDDRPATKGGKRFVVKHVRGPFRLRHTLGPKGGVHPSCKGENDRLRRLRCVGNGATPKDVLEAIFGPAGALCSFFGGEGGHSRGGGGGDGGSEGKWAGEDEGQEENPKEEVEAVLPFGGEVPSFTGPWRSTMSIFERRVEASLSPCADPQAVAAAAAASGGGGSSGGGSSGGGASEDDSSRLWLTSAGEWQWSFAATPGATQQRWPIRQLRVEVSFDERGGRPSHSAI